MGEDEEGDVILITSCAIVILIYKCGAVILSEIVILRRALSPPKDLTTARGGNAVNAITRQNAVRPVRVIGTAYSRKVPHAGFTAIQDDMAL